MALPRSAVACAAVVLIGAAGASVDPHPAPAGAADAAATRKSCRTDGAFVVRRGGSGVALGRVRRDGGVSYTACSTRYGRTVRLATDPADGAQSAFTLGPTRVSGTTATLVYCLRDALGADRHAVKANLRTGRTVRTSTAFETADCR